VAPPSKTVLSLTENMWKIKMTLMVKLSQGFPWKRWWSICICCLRCWPEGLVKEEDTLWLTYAPPLNSQIYSNKIHLCNKFPTLPSKTRHFSFSPVFHTITKKLHSLCLQASCSCAPWAAHFHERTPTNPASHYQEWPLEWPPKLISLFCKYGTV